MEKIYIFQNLSLKNFGSQKEFWVAEKFYVKENLLVQKNLSLGHMTLTLQFLQNLLSFEIYQNIVDKDS